MTFHTLYQIIMLLCGIALLLYGMQEGEKSLKRLGGARLRQIIAAITRHRLTGYLTGFLTTLVTQSSSATTVMLVGLASAQLMTLRQSLSVILGSDLGTTITVQLFAFKFYLIAPVLIVFGFTVAYLWRSKPPAGIGKLILALGFVFYGMELMAEASGSLRNHPLVSQWVSESFSNPWIGLAAGACITAIIHSSAATLAIVIAMADHFVIADHSGPGIGQLLPIVLGANIGTCSTAFLAIIQAETEGVRVAWGHLLFKICGSVLILPCVWLLKDSTLLSSWPIAMQIAALHTGFNLFLSAFCLPLVPLFDRLIHAIVKPRKETRLRFHSEYLHEKVLPIPELALSQAQREISRSADIVVYMVDESLECIRRYDSTRRLRIIDRDDEVDFLHDAIMGFLTRIAREDLGPDDAKRLSMLLMVITDIEHIGDIVSKSIVELANKIDQSPVPLSDEGKQELLDFFSTAATRLRETLTAFSLHDRDRAQKVIEGRPESKARFSSYVDFHMNRLYRHKVESLQTTSIHIDLLEEINRINHFTFRIAGHIINP